MLTGFPGEKTSYGAVVARMAGFTNPMPPYVHIGSKLAVGGGKLGAPYDPLEVRDPAGKKIELPQFSLAADVSAERFSERQHLLHALDTMRARAAAEGARLDRFHQLAAEILTSERVRDSFDLAHESVELRDRYGANFFGQSCLMARRLVEAGTRFVQIKWYDGPAWDAWDVHGADLGGMERMEHHLCPRLDQGLTALLDDLHERGLLDSTLVVVTGEFGARRRSTSSAPAIIGRLVSRCCWPAAACRAERSSAAATSRVPSRRFGRSRRRNWRPRSIGCWVST